MGLAPDLHAQEVGQPAEVIAALGRGAPAALAGALAGLAAGRLRTVPLVKAVARVGIVELSAVTALTPPLGCHDLPKIGAPGLRRQARRFPKKTQWKKTRRKKTQGGRRRFVEGVEEDAAEEEPHLQTG